LYLDPNLRVTNASISGNIGIGQGGGFIGSGSGTVAGTVMFAAPATAEPVFSPDGIAVTGGATFGNANVQADVIAVTNLSRTLGAITDTPTAIITGGGSVDASSGKLVNGNYVFTGVIGTTDGEFPRSTFNAGDKFTVNGTSDQLVVINIPDIPTIDEETVGFDGSIVLAGGITPDHVLFNFDKGDFDTLTGGDTLMIDTDGNPTTGIFLDPNGNFLITDSMIFGRIFGGGAEFDSIIQTLHPTDPSFRTNIVAPPPFQTPEPTSLALLGAGLAALGMFRRHRRSVGLLS
jgi:hypothetical protein